MTEGFDFETWLQEAHDGLKGLRAKREALERERETVETAIADTDQEIAALEKMLEAQIGVVPKYEGDPSKESVPTKRVTGVKKAVREFASEMVIGDPWTEDKIVTLIQGRVEGAREKSIRSACQGLAKEGVFIQEGKRGAWTFSTTIGVVPKDGHETTHINLTVTGPQEPAESPEESEAPASEESAPAQESTQEAPEQGSLLDVSDEPSPAEVVVVGTAEVIMAIEKELKRKKQVRVAEKNIGWIAADLHCEPKVVRDALKLMVEGDYEFGYDGDDKVLRRRAEPGSKEELKRTSIKDRPLFPEADRPPHA